MSPETLRLEVALRDAQGRRRKVKIAWLEAQKTVAGIGGPDAYPLADRLEDEYLQARRDEAEARGRYCEACYQDCLAGQKLREDAALEAQYREDMRRLDVSTSGPYPGRRGS